MAKPDAGARFRAAADAEGITVQPVHYPEGCRTAADAAAAVGCSVAQIVKSLVLTGPDGAVLALTAGDNRIDLDAVAGLLGGPARMATANEAREASGFAIGGTPPFGHPAPLTTLLDQDLLLHEKVFAAAGTPDSCFPIDPRELARVTRASVAAFVEVS